MVVVRSIIGMFIFQLCIIVKELIIQIPYKNIANQNCLYQNERLNLLKTAKRVSQIKPYYSQNLFLITRIYIGRTILTCLISRSYTTHCMCRKAFNCLIFMCCPIPVSLTATCNLKKIFQIEDSHIYYTKQLNDSLYGIFQRLKSLYA